MKELEFFEKIEDYLKNRLSAEAQAAFEEQMNVNPALAEAVELHRDLMAATGEKDVHDLRRQMEEIYREQAEEKPGAILKALPKGGGMSATYRRIILTAAAAVLVGIVAITVWKPWGQTPEAPIAKPSEPSPALPAPQILDDGIAEAPPLPPASSPKPHTPQKPANKSKQTDTETDKRRYIAMADEAYRASSGDWGGTLKSGESRGEILLEEKAEAAFAKQDYQEALKILADSDTLSPVAIYLRGHAHFRLENYAAAATDFRALLHDEGYAADAEWYLLLSLLAQKGTDDAEAKELIKQMRKSGDHPYHPDLQRLLPKIRGR